MQSHGGMNVATHILTSLAWRWIIYPFLVWFLYLLLFYSNYVEWSIATSIDVECLFSRGRLLLSHVRSQLSAQSTRALLCLGTWSELKLVKTEDVTKVSALPDVKGDEEEMLEDGWDNINRIFE